MALTLKETARRNRQDILKARLTRRDLFRLGLLTAAGTLVPKRGLTVSESGGSPESPPTTPFLEPLPIPPVAGQVTRLDPPPEADPVPGEAERPIHQRWDQFLPQKLYDIPVREASHSFHPELPPQTIWGYDGIFPGPTLHARYGEPVVVRFQNDLPEDHTGFGMPQITTHLHGGHVASESDGFPADFYDPGLFKDHHYPNALAGFAGEFAPAGDRREAQGTLWYHDHRFDFTAQNTYKGLAGFYLLFDDRDSGNEEDPDAFRLPSGDFDVPLAFADKVFDPDGQLFFDLFNFDGILGDKFTVNGKIQPFFEVARRKYRFRFLNGGPSRFYRFSLSNRLPFTVIANDGNLLPRPLESGSFDLTVAERIDAVVDFSRAKVGDRIFLENRLEQRDGRGPTGKILPSGEAPRILRFDVVCDANDPSRVPDFFFEPPPVVPGDVAATREWRFDRSQGAWTVNNKFFDVNRVDAAPKEGTAEIWTLKNNSGGWEHPIHIHLEEFQVISRNGRPAPPIERGRKDVILLGRNEEIQVLMRFRDWLGRYPIHCHNTIHEDHAMMARFDVVPA